ncbi:M1 family metallopeptidase [Nostocoides vanveenii]|uniref:Aminopeptidase N n=1 Tax=Nostocoides vanveenii TaxID=330835 RepID=A0ABN2K8U8_9MICO
MSENPLVPHPPLPAPDSYLPTHGDVRFAARHYGLTLDYRVATNHLVGTAVITAEALTDLNEIALDLYNLHVSRVRVGGRPVKYAQRGSRLIVRTSQQHGARFEIDVAYAGKPRPMPGAHGRAGWEELTDGVLVGSQPHGAPSWFPCNDRPSNKAPFAITVTTEAGYHVAAGGVLKERHTRSGRTTWTYAHDEPTATYLATVQIGQYAVRPVPAPVPVAIVAPAGLDVGAGSAFARQGEMVAAFISRFGPYPFATYTAVVTDDPLEIPLEAQALSSFGRNHAAPAWANERLVAHELAHQWFGNALTAADWRDIWLHEGFACYAEWLWSEAAGGQPASEHAADHYSRLALPPRGHTLTDPGLRAMFDDWVYKRGALTVHTLRQAVGDASFFAILRTWVAARSGGNVSTEAFLAHIEAYLGRPVPELRPWLFERDLPPLGQ